MAKSSTYAIGVDFGTESARSVLVRLADRAEIETATHLYEHGVMTETLAASGEKLAPNTALQDPDDYLVALEKVVRAVVDRSGVDPQQIVGLGVDTTACTIVLTDDDLVPLPRSPRWKKHPLAYARLWKHHAAQSHAEEINRAAEAEGGLFLPQYGGRLSSEWVLPKALQTLRDDREVYDATSRIIEQEDWIVSTLVGTEVRGASVAGFKGNYREESGGYPSPEFLNSLEPGFAGVLDKLGHEFLTPGESAGTLTSEWATRLGLDTHVTVAAGNIDAHAAFLGAGAAQPGTMVAVMGTSVCNLVVSKEHRTPRGIQGVVKNGILPDHWAYEAGQAGFGDTFGWFARNMTSADIADLASISATSTFEVLESKAQALQPGGSGLIVLDWMNGNRSTLIDSNLSGAIVGLTLDTRDYHIYRALLEGAAFGQRIILEAFEEAEVPINRFIVCGGIPAKSPLLMQILADVIGMPVEVSSSANTSALGAALHGAIAAGELTWESAGKAESAIATVYRPNPTAHEAYNEIYTHYRAIHDTFGIDQRSLMHSLREIQANSTH